MISARVKKKKNEIFCLLSGMSRKRVRFSEESRDDGVCMADDSGDASSKIICVSSPEEDIDYGEAIYLALTKGKYNLATRLMRYISDNDIEINYNVPILDDKFCVKGYNSPLHLLLDSNPPLNKRDKTALIGRCSADMLLSPNAEGKKFCDRVLSDVYSPLQLSTVDAVADRVTETEIQKILYDNVQHYGNRYIIYQLSIKAIRNGKTVPAFCYSFIMGFSGYDNKLLDKWLNIDNYELYEMPHRILTQAKNVSSYGIPSEYPNFIYMNILHTNRNIKKSHEVLARLKQVGQLENYLIHLRSLRFASPEMFAELSERHGHRCLNYFSLADAISAKYKHFSTAIDYPYVQEYIGQQRFCEEIEKTLSYAINYPSKYHDNELVDFICGLRKFINSYEDVKYWEDGYGITLQYSLIADLGERFLFAYSSQARELYEYRELITSLATKDLCIRGEDALYYYVRNLRNNSRGIDRCIVLALIPKCDPLALTSSGDTPLNLLLSTITAPDWELCGADVSVAVKMAQHCSSLTRDELFQLMKICNNSVEQKKCYGFTKDKLPASSFPLPPDFSHMVVEKGGDRVGVESRLVDMYKSGLVSVSEHTVELAQRRGMTKLLEAMGAEMSGTDGLSLIEEINEMKLSA